MRLFFEGGFKLERAHQSSRMAARRLPFLLTFCYRLWFLATFHSIVMYCSIRVGMRSGFISRAPLPSTTAAVSWNDAADALGSLSINLLSKNLLQLLEMFAHSSISA